MTAPVTLDVSLAELMPAGITWSGLPRTAVTFHQGLVTRRWQPHNQVGLPGHPKRGVPTPGAIVVFGLVWPRFVVLRTYVGIVAPDKVTRYGELLLRRITLTPEQMRYLRDLPA